MLLKLLKRWAGGSAADPSARVPDLARLDRARDLMLAGDNQGAIKAYREYLETDPYNVVALNDLGACFAETGDIAQAVASLELAHSLDDTFVPAMVNFAKLLNDNRASAEEALRLLRRAKISQPDFTHTDAVYAGICFKQGDGPRAARFQQRAWLANFDNLRLANGAMFWGSYSLSEAQTAAEHRFWAETLRPLDPPAETSPRPHARRARIRIGYWSPDFRGHSVRFFFRPMLESHDRERFELVLFHDCPLQDEQTAQIKAAAEHFHDVHEMPDVRLRDFIREQELDILVDLAGHTSFNRLPLLQDRLATLQINALGYPPTTGLSTIDAKLMDRHVATDADRHWYAEKPMILPGSFWCYDPMLEVELPAGPPVRRNGHVTFACVGNIAKITHPLLAAWRAILERVPDARLVIRSINFEDTIAIAGMQALLEDAQIALERVELLPPKGVNEFFTSYNEIDIVLDTFPFNGGTTTCFATYMGVPVVTLVGESLVSRMGLSVMSNLGAPELAVATLDEYVERAVALAGDAPFLERFRREARSRYKDSPLGNGRMFTREFEAACERVLAEKSAGTLEHHPELPTLPEAEIMRRAYAIMRRGQVEAAERVSDFCLRCYPESGKPHLLKAQLLIWGRRSREALDYLEHRLPAFPEGDRVSALLVIARLHLMAKDPARAAGALGQARRLGPQDPFDRLQIAFYEACLAAKREQPTQHAVKAESVSFLVPCDSVSRFDRMASQLASACPAPPGWQVRIVRCSESERIAAYEAALRASDASIVVMVQKNVEIHSPWFLSDIQNALQVADVVGCAGARRWSRLDWRLDSFEEKAGSFLSPSSEQEGSVEVHWFGAGRNALESGLAVLDASVLALRPMPAASAPFREQLSSAGTLLEEAWVHDCGQLGLRLGVHRNLGVFIDSALPLDESDRTEARVSYALERNFDPFADEGDDYLSVSAPAADAAAAVSICRTYLSADL